MTQIVTCLTQDYVAMAADRKLTNLETGELVNDEAQKLIVLGSQIALAYTGLANVKPAPRGETDLWVANKLSPPPESVEKIIRTVQDAATERFRLITHVGPRRKRHAFVFAGWRPDAADRLEAFVAWSSNALDDRGRWEVRARPSFAAHGYLLQEQAVHVMDFGQPWSGKPARGTQTALAGKGPSPRRRSLRWSRRRSGERRVSTPRPAEACRPSCFRATALASVRFSYNRRRATTRAAMT